MLQKCIFTLDSLLFTIYSVFDFKKAAEAQNRIASRLILNRGHSEADLIAGADFSYHRTERLVGAVIVVQKIAGFEIVEVSDAIERVSIPYVPGFLNFREGPAFLRAFRKIKNRPEITLVDGNGIAHPRKMGLASYVGVILDISTIGCAKKPFFPYRTPDVERGAYTVFENLKKEEVGVCLRTRSGVRPVFVSPGHRMDISSARECVLSCSTFRIPEPLRTAHNLAAKLFS
jgi:deoxyribonuclease V